MTNANPQYKKGQLWNGFDTDLEVMVKKGIIQNCNHPKEIKEKYTNTGFFCCNASKYAGQKITDVRKQLGV